jgi:hypothetical protein
MLTRVFATAALIAVVVSGTAFRQAGAVDDPLSGRWGMDGLTFLDLQFDGKRAVSGTTIWRYRSDYEERAAVNSGTFDRKSGALRLTGEVKNKDGDVVPYAVEGTLEKDVLSGTWSVGESRGDFRFTRLAADLLLSGRRPAGRPEAGTSARSGTGAGTPLRP